MYSCVTIYDDCGRCNEIRKSYEDCRVLSIEYGFNCLYNTHLVKQEKEMTYIRRQCTKSVVGIDGVSQYLDVTSHGIGKYKCNTYSNN